MQRAVQGLVKMAKFSPSKIKRGNSSELHTSGERKTDTARAELAVPILDRKAFSPAERKNHIRKKKEKLQAKMELKTPADIWKGKSAPEALPRSQVRYNL